MVNKKDQLKEEAQEFVERQETQGKILYEKWSKNDIGCGDTSEKGNVDIRKVMESNPEKAMLVAKALEKQEAHLMRLDERTIASDFSTTPENLLKIVKKGVANSNRSEMFTEVSLDSTDDALYFIDMTHESTLTGRQMSAGDKIFEKAYEYTAGESAYVDQAGDGTTSNTITADHTPIMEFQVHVTVDKELVAYDSDGSGTLTVVSGNSAGVSAVSANYTTGEITLTSTSAIAASSTIRLIYQWDSEQSTLYAQYPKVTLAISKKRFKARPQPLGYSYSMMMELMLGTQMKEDVNSLLVNAVSAEHARSRDFKAVSLARRVAKTNEEYAFNTAFADEGEISDKSHAQRILSVIDNIGGRLHDELLRGSINTIIAGTAATTYLRKHDLWTEDTSQPREGVYKAGMLGDKTVFTCPANDALVANNEMLLTFKNPLQGLDVGIAFGVLTELAASLTYPQMYIDGNVATVEDEMIITREFVRLLTLNNLETYVSS